MKHKPTICWLVDVPGWAYDKRARMMTAALPHYEHVRLFNIVANYATALPVMSKADIIVCPDPRILPYVPGRDNVVLNLNAPKIFW